MNLQLTTYARQSICRSSHCNDTLTFRANIIASAETSPCTVFRRLTQIISALELGNRKTFEKSPVSYYNESIDRRQARDILFDDI